MITIKSYDGYIYRILLNKDVTLYLLEKEDIISKTDGMVTLSCKTGDQKSATKTATVNEITG